MRHTEIFAKTLAFLVVLSIAACDWRGDDTQDVLVPRTVADSLYTETASGLRYFDFELGNGDVTSQSKDLVRVQYVLWTWPSKVFVENGQFPFTIGSGNAIAGFDEGARGMKLQGERQIVVPSELAYGAGELLFEIFMTEIDTTGRTP